MASFRMTPPGRSDSQAILLGAIQGPAELLPVSSSAHLVLVPWLLHWRYAELDPEIRKSFEVAAHAGTACALLLALRKNMIDFVRRTNLRELTTISLSFLPAAAIGYRWERTIERRLGSPPLIAVSLAAGSLAMLVADRSPELRHHTEAGPADGLALGVAQAAALAPGISRNGATLAAARWRRFTRGEANELSRRVALPVIVGASFLKLTRLSRRGIDPSLRRTLEAGFTAAFLSTFASLRLISRVERSRSLRPYACYRLALAGLTLAAYRCRASTLRA